MNKEYLNQKSQKKVPRVLSVIPCEVGGNSMLFIKKQVESLEKAGVINRTFYLTSRTSPLLLAKEWLRFQEEIKGFKPDLIHAHFGTMTAFFCMVFVKCPVIVTYRGCDLYPDPQVSLLRGVVGVFLSQISAMKAKRIICVSKLLKEKLWWGKKKATVIPTGVDTTIFYPFPQDKARVKLGWKKQERVVLFNSGSNPVRKRIDLAKSGVDVAKALCADIRIVILNGSVENGLIPMMMNAANCLLVTSDWEGSPNIVKEALACNLPVVSVDVGDVKERLNGVLPSRIIERDPNKIGKALVEVLMKSCRSNGYETIRDLSLERIATRILEVYQEIIKNIDNH